MSAQTVIWKYDTPRNSAITNAAAPMTGGMICPPVDATASTAAANGGRKPLRFMSGIVIGPSTSTFATALPEIVPNRLELTTATLPGPPALRPVSARANSMKSCPTPVRSMKVPKRTNRITYPADTPSVGPKMPSVVRYIISTICSGRALKAA